MARTHGKVREILLVCLLNFMTSTLALRHSHRGPEQTLNLVAKTNTTIKLNTTKLNISKLNTTAKSNATVKLNVSSAANGTQRKTNTTVKVNTTLNATNLNNVSKVNASKVNTSSKVNTTSTVNASKANATKLNVTTKVNATSKLNVTSTVNTTSKLNITKLNTTSKLNTSNTTSNTTSILPEMNTSTVKTQKSGTCPTAPFNWTAGVNTTNCGWGDLHTLSDLPAIQVPTGECVFECWSDLNDCLDTTAYISCLKTKTVYKSMRDTCLGCVGKWMELGLGNHCSTVCIDPTSHNCQLCMKAATDDFEACSGMNIHASTLVTGGPWTTKD